ncbi:MAG: hypothetical protein IKS34_00900 [Clostridia bacterium]|nr:hypothetical protein [Clostridia bacterium]
MFETTRPDGFEMAGFSTKNAFFIFSWLLFRKLHAKMGKMDVQPHSEWSFF